MDILYHDADIVVLIKPRGILSEGKQGEDCVPGLLQQEFGPLYPVHRLDRAVGGVMVYARNKRAAARLSAAVQSGELKKEYTAIVTGVPEVAEGELCDFLYHDARANKTFVVDRARKGAKEARLFYRLDAQKTHNGVVFSRIFVQLMTGRSHQIRVQFASRRLPLVGDGKYGSRQKAAFPALFATGLSFPHPKNGEPMTFTAPTPNDFPWELFTKSHYEIERKLLIALPDVSALAALQDCRIKRIAQTYLSAPQGETRRVREVREGECVRYVYTLKRRVSMLRAVEEERSLTGEEYKALLAEADPTRRTLQKTRYAFPYGGHTVEVDVFDGWEREALLEVELSDESEDFSLPDFIRILRDVSEDPDYKNVNLARK